MEPFLKTQLAYLQGVLHLCRMVNSGSDSTDADTHVAYMSCHTRVALTENLASRGVFSC
mgnify:CR=1